MTINKTPCSGNRRRNLKFQITSVLPRDAGGAWVSGIVMNFTFEALVFPKHAAYPDYEIERSRIFKLHIRRIANRATVYAWDRGLDIPVTDAGARRAVNILCARLASIVFDQKS